MVINCPRGSIPFPQSRCSAQSPSPHFDSCPWSLWRLDYCLTNRSSWDPIGRQTLRISVALRLGLNVWLAHQCRCGATVQSDGLYPLSCRFSAGRFPRHSAINNIIKRSLYTAGLHSILEPISLDQGDGGRPDWVTSFPFKGGKALAWDATCTDSFSTSNLYSTILNPISASRAAEDLKIKKYSQLVTDYEFEPVAVETSGIIGSAGCSILTDNGHRILRATDDPCQMSYIFQQITVAIIRGNALAMTASSRRYFQELVERYWHSKWRCIVLFYCFIIDCDNS